MCGILVIVDKNGNPLDQSVCFSALDELKKRGPDLTVSSFPSKNIFFAQSILSIVGPQEKKGLNHLRSQSRRYQLLFNGEIYNYSELERKHLSQQHNNPYRTIDANVLINLFETIKSSHIPHLLDGMYAYATYDHLNNTIDITRDPQGEKSLFIYENETTLVISSVISPILKVSNHISYNYQVLRNYFRTRHFMFLEETPFQGIKQLLPGATERFSLSSMSWQRIDKRNLTDWVNSDLFDQYKHLTPEEASDCLDGIMRTTVKEMIPETNFASIVTGGIDSSLVTSYLREEKHPDFMIAINHVGKDYISDDLNSFESVFNEKIKVLNVDLKQYGQEIKRCQEELCGPLFTHSFVGQSILSSVVKSEGCKVLFGGEAADELFGGYSCYYNFHENIGRFSPSDYTRCTDPQINFLKDNPSKYHDELQEAWQGSLNAYRDFQQGRDLALQAMMLCDASYQLSSVGLRGSDIMASMWGVENRSIFLRKPILEFVLNIPVKHKINQSAKNDILGTKPLLKDLFKKKYPGIDIKKKQGFAGFPNEAITFLGDHREFITYDLLHIDKNDFSFEKLERDAAWKIINLEFFFRSNLLNNL